MATIKPIQFKRSKTAGSRPTAAQVLEGELALNLQDRMIFTKDDKGNIIDLGFAKGGNVDGDIVHKGKYTQTGDYIQTGNLTTSGDINAKTVTTSSDIVSNAGVIRTRSNSASNSHVWFEGEEASSNNNERAVLYAIPQTATVGAVNLRVMHGFDNSKAQATFTFSGSGDFQAPKDVNAQRGRFSIETVAPTTNTSRIYTRGRKFAQFGQGDGLYAWNDLVDWVPGEGGALALNYVYKGRAAAAETIWHQLLDARNGDEWALYTGSNPSNKVFATRSVDGKGHGNFTGNLHVGGVMYSVLGDNSITLGDNDTGFKWISDGNFNISANGRTIVKYTPARIVQTSTVVSALDNTGNEVAPANNNAQLAINTSHDSNNSGGNGTTLLGYISGGKYSHHFRGKGAAFFDMWEGLHVQQGGLNVTGAATFNSPVLPKADISIQNDTKVEWVRNTDWANIRFVTNKSDDPDTHLQFGLGDNGKEYFKFVSTAGTTQREWARIRDGQVIPANYGNFDSRYQNIFDLGANRNLNSVTTVGEYSQHANANVSTALNYPEAQAGHLTVSAGAGVQQRYHVYNTSRIYTRAQYGTDAWTPWQLTANRETLPSGRLDVEFVSKSSNAFRAAYGAHGFFIRNDGNTTYFLLTNANDAMGPYNALRPIAITNSNGAVSIGNGLTTNTLNVTSGAITWGSAGAAVANDGNIKGTRWAAFGNSTWAADALGWVHNNNVSKGGDTMSGVLTMNNNINMQQVTNRGITVGAGSGTGIWTGNDSANNDWCNIEIRSWYGVGFKNTQNSGAAYYNKNTIFMNLRDGTMQAYNVYIRSDKAYKENIIRIDNALDKVDAINGYTYNIKGSNDKARTTGVIAQEIQEVLPEAVTKSEDGKLQVNYNGVIALLINSVKELKARVEYLESK